jgi:hypothetical protein
VWDMCNDNLCLNLYIYIFFQASDAKDLNLSSLSPSSFGLRPLDSYGGLPAQLVHLQNPFLHPALEARLPFGTAGAFRPVVTSSSSSTSTPSSVEERMSVKSLPSAFSTPSHSNRRKLESIVEGGGMEHQQQRTHRGGNNEGNSFGGGGGGGAINLDKSSPSPYMNGGQSRHRSCSPVNCSPSSRERGEQGERERSDDYPGEERDANGTPNSDMTDRSTPDESHISKRKFISLFHFYGSIIPQTFIKYRSRLELVALNNSNGK